MYKKLLVLSIGFMFIACNSTSTEEEPIKTNEIYRNDIQYFQRAFYIESTSHRAEPMQLKMPEYPLQEYEARFEGACDVQFKLEVFYTTVKRTIYSPRDISVLNCDSPNFISACKSAVMAWRFAIMNNEKENALDVEFNSICTFKINDTGITKH